jgi:hypothetical protein
MLQLLGGVAVAGAVAAGTTAFTASGVALNGSLGTGLASGGSASVTITGVATLFSASITQSPSNPNQLTGASIVLKNGDATGFYQEADVAKIKVKFTGNANGGGGTQGWTTCAVATAATEDGAFTCAVPNGFLEDITALQIAVTV